MAQCLVSLECRAISFFPLLLRVMVIGLSLPWQQLSKNSWSQVGTNRRKLSDFKEHWGVYVGSRGMVSALNTPDLVTIICVYGVWMAFSEWADICSLSVMPDERNVTLALVPSMFPIKEQFRPWRRHGLTLVYKHNYFKPQLIAVSLITLLPSILGKTFLYA